MNWDLILEILGFTVGIIYLWYEYHASPRMWIASVIMPMISLWIYFRKGLYADFGINIYYLAMAVYGYIIWTVRPAGKTHDDKKPARPITRMPALAWVGCVSALAAVWALLGWGLVAFTDSNVPWHDAFTTALSIVAMWMLARKYVEQWLAWLIVDAVCVGLYCYKGIYLYATLYAIYTVIAWLGYRKWLRMMREGQKDT
ncbi:MAG: nicotinamide riboside transporter PnuC [Bacteroidales bacterium]|nr:nicotinamide riboside transporter PnuC [Bacteroidales bacterium]